MTCWTTPIGRRRSHTLTSRPRLTSSPLVSAPLLCSRSLEIHCQNTSQFQQLWLLCRTAVNNRVCARLLAADACTAKQCVHISQTCCCLNPDSRKLRVPFSCAVVVNFYAPWCPWCKRLEPTWEAVTAEVHKRYPEHDGRIRFGKVSRCTVQQCSTLRSEHRSDAA